MTPKAVVRIALDPVAVTVTVEGRCPDARRQCEGALSEGARAALLSGHWREGSRPVAFELRFSERALDGWTEATGSLAFPFTADAAAAGHRAIEATARAAFTAAADWLERQAVPVERRQTYRAT